MFGSHDEALQATLANLPHSHRMHDSGSTGSLYQYRLRERRPLQSGDGARGRRPVEGERHGGRNQHGRNQYRPRHHPLSRTRNMPRALAHGGLGESAQQVAGDADTSRPLCARCWFLALVGGPRFGLSLGIPHAAARDPTISRMAERIITTLDQVMHIILG